MPDFAVVTAFKATDKMSPVFGKIENRIRRVTSGLERMVGLGKGSMLRDLMPAAGITGVIMIGNAVKEAAKQSDALKTSFASVFQGDAANQMKFVRAESNRLGLDLVMAADAYKGIAAAAKGTAISNRDVQNTFLGVSEAATALQLTSEQSKGALLAISQIISKGKVSMEELRGQLGERIPGAMQIAARSMGVTTAELEKLVARGIPAEKFIPRFAAQMRKEFGPAAVDASKKFAASEQRFKNLMFTMKASVGNVLLPVLNDAMMILTPFIAALANWMEQNQDMVTSIVKIAVPAIAILAGGYIAAKVGLMLWRGALIAHRVAMVAWNGVMAIANLIKWLNAMRNMGPLLDVATKSTRVATTAQWLWNVALNANPIGLIALAIAALIGAIVVLIKYGDELVAVFAKFTKILDHPVVKGLLMGSGMGQVILATNEKVKQARAAGHNFEAPNQARESNRQSIDFQGNLNIAGAPNGSTVSSKTRGAPAINMNLVGVQ